MPAVFLYIATAAVVLLVWHRRVQPVTRSAAIVLFLIPFCFTGRALLTGGVYAPIDLPFMSEPLKDYARDYGIERAYNGTISDLYTQMIPWQHAVRESLDNGEWPLWNPYMLCGSVLAANMQSGVYDPLQWLGFLLPLPQALTYAAALNFFLAALFTFTFLRALGLRDVAALIGAAAYAFCEINAFFVGWPIGRVWMIFPLLMFAVRMVVRETSLRAAVLLTTAFVLIIVAGHPESVLHTVVVGAVYGAYEVATTRRTRSIGLAALCGVLALLLTAIALLPFADAAPQTFQYAGRRLYFADVAFVAEEGQVARRTWMSIFPWFHGAPELGRETRGWEPTNFRVGSVTLALAVAAMLLARRRDTWFFAILAVVCAWAGVNAWPVAQILHALPLFDIAFNDRLAFVAAFALATLAAIAVDAWPADRKRSLMLGLVLALSAAALALGTALFRSSQIAKGVSPELITRLALAELVPLALVAAMALRALTAVRALPLVLALLLMQRTIVDGGIYPTLRGCSFYPGIPILRAMQDDPDIFRMTGLHYALLPAGSTMYGLEDARGYEAMTLRRLYDTYALWSIPSVSFNNVPDKNKPFLSFLNVKYAVGSLDARPDAQWATALQDRQSRLLRNQKVIARAFVPQLIRYERDQNAILAQMKMASDFLQQAWIETPEYPPHHIANGPGTLRIRRDGAAAYDIDATMENDGWVVISESAWPGWRAYVDGKRVETRYANHAFIGVFVPKGQHALRLVYQPESFTRGRNITLASLLAVIAYFVWRHRRYRVTLPASQAA